MSSLPEENTLGVVIGSKPRRRVPDATRRVIRAAAPHRSSLGTSFIAIGAAVIVGLRAIYGFAWFIGLWPLYGNPYAALGAWLVLIVTLVGTFVAARVINDRLPDWAFGLFLLGLTAAIVLDLLAVWPLHDIGRHATAALTACMGLLIVLTLRRTRDIELSISEETAKSYLKRIREKYRVAGFDVGTKVALRKRAIEDGILVEGETPRHF